MSGAPPDEVTAHAAAPFEAVIFGAAPLEAQMNDLADFMQLL
jgi:hypothetical protein